MRCNYWVEKLLKRLSITPWMDVSAAERLLVQRRMASVSQITIHVML